MKKLYGFASDGLLVKKGGYLFPKLICQEMTSHPNIKIIFNHCFHNWSKKDARLNIEFLNQKRKCNFDDLIIANGPSLEKFYLDLRSQKVN